MTKKRKVSVFIDFYGNLKSSMVAELCILLLWRFNEAAII